MDKVLVMKEHECKILKVIHDRDYGATGFEITQLTGLSASILYPILLTLEEQYLLLSHWAYAPEGKPRKRVYKLSDLGKKVLSENS